MTTPSPSASLAPPASDSASALEADEARWVEALRAGDEAAFAALVDRYHQSMVRTAMLYVRDRPAAEEVVQEAWIGVLRGIDRFEGRSSLKTWLFRIVSNKAKTRGVRDKRSQPFSALRGLEDGAAEGPAPERLLPSDAPEWADHWSMAPESWQALDERLETQEALRVVEAAIETLPDGQKAVITLRDIEGWGSKEVCNALEISATNQRVLLHRARSKVRAALETWLEETLDG